VEKTYPVAYNLGCGKTRWDGWIGVDLTEGAEIQSDIRKLSAIETDSADAVAAIHVLEHFYEREVFDIIREWRRILKPAGTMILELPSLDKMCGYIHWAIQNRQPPLAFMTLGGLYGDQVADRPEMQHKWAWGAKSLMRVLEMAGMREVKHLPPNYHFACRDMRIEAIK
jgi:ubiquinone/menaquinone biosynthesis C-methylase UbiE